MKKIISILPFLICSFLCIHFSFAQRIKVIGDFEFLKNVSDVNVVFNYDSMKIKTDSITYRQQYFIGVKKMARPNLSFSNAEKEKYQREFIKTFNSYCIPFRINNDTVQPYTMLVEMQLLEPGYNTYRGNRNAMLDAVISFVETGNEDAPFLQFIMKNIEGKTIGLNSVDYEGRILSAYSSLGISAVKQSRLNENLKVKRSITYSEYRRNERQEKIDIYGKDYYKDRRLSKTFLISGCVVGGAGIFTMFFGGLEATLEPVHSNNGTVNASNNKSEAKKLVMIGGGIALASAPLFYFGAKYNQKSKSKKVALSIRNQIIQTPKFIYEQPTLGICLTF